MIEPDKITNYKRTEDELIEFLIFCVFVAGHNSHVTAYALERFLDKYVTLPPKSLKDSLKIYFEGTSQAKIAKHLQSVGIGCFTRNAQFLKEVHERIIVEDFNLKKATVEELETFTGIGPKSSRFFVMHSRKGVKNIAVLDRHVLKFMEEQGVKVPKSTPSGKRYKELEEKFINLAEASGKSLADFDLDIWKAKRIKNG